MVRNQKFIWHHLTPSWQLGLMSGMAALVLIIPFLLVLHELQARNYSIDLGDFAIFQGLVQVSHIMDRKVISQDVAQDPLTVDQQTLNSSPLANQPSPNSVPAQKQSANPPKITTPNNSKAGESSQTLYAGLSGKWPKDILQWGNFLGKFCVERDKIPINLAAAVIYKESWFPIQSYPEGYQRCPDGPSTSSCTSTAGAIGIMQVMPFHAKNGENLRDPETNISKGCAILRAYIDQMGSIRAGLAAYYAGPDGANQGVGWDYADSVLKYYDQFK